MPREKREYIVGHYRYVEMPRAGTACVRVEDLDTLPPTMYTCMTRVEAWNKREAVFKFRDFCTSQHR